MQPVPTPVAFARGAPYSLNSRVHVLGFPLETTGGRLSRMRCASGGDGRPPMSFGDRILDYIEGGPKLRRWYGAADQLPRENLATSEARPPPALPLLRQGLRAQPRAGPQAPPLLVAAALRAPAQRGERHRPRRFASGSRSLRPLAVPTEPLLPAPASARRRCPAVRPACACALEAAPGDSAAAASGAARTPASEGPAASQAGASGELPPTAEPLAAAPAAAEAPFLAALSACARQTPATAAFHFPGHGRGRAAPPALAAALGPAPFLLDLPELPELGSLLAPEAVLEDAQRRAARAFGAAYSFFLVNGSTVGVQAAVMACCPPGRSLLLPRNAHQSALAALVLSGARPRYLRPAWDPALGVALAVAAEEVEEALAAEQAEGRRVGAVLVVSPTYHGVCSDVAAIARVCRAAGVPLIVDEAHGAHLPFLPPSPTRFPSALASGAALAVQSTHKVLPALTQAAMLHLGPACPVPASAVASCLRLLHSSSPSALLLASLDAAAGHVASPAFAASLANAADLAASARASLAALPGLSVLLPGAPPLGPTSALDPLRLTVGVAGLGLSGFAVDDLLRLRFRVVAELPFAGGLSFAFSAGTRASDARQLLAAFRQLSAEAAQRAAEGGGEGEWEAPRDAQRGSGSQRLQALLEALLGAAPRLRLSPREAFFRAAEVVPLEEAAGRTAAGLVCPYPPGIPCILPGEEVPPQAVEFVQLVRREGGIVAGVEEMEGEARGRLGLRVCSE